MLVQEGPPSTQQYEIKDWLRGLSWEHLVSLQYDIADELARRVREMKLASGLSKDKEDHTEELISTQTSATEAVQPQTGYLHMGAPSTFPEGDGDSQPLIPGTLELRNKHFVLSSSPLKKELPESQNSQNSPRRNLRLLLGPRLAPKQSSPTKSPRRSPTKEVSTPRAKQTQEAHEPIDEDEAEQISDSEGDLSWDSKLPDVHEGQEKRAKIDFNTNPIAKRPWIYEDFQANHEVLEELSKKRLKDHRRNVMDGLAGLPNKLGGEANYDSSFDESFPMYDNLRHRSKSPPGYGRLDFPTTQEIQDDKRKAQDMIYQRTKHRFKMAVQRKIPIFEREYFFKNPQLNTWVDNGEISWSKEELQIFKRT
ncbi:ADL048Cp [Eremothecium gossypii ATCC 10895]|uniref:ADL048Cp n=1 Tax=Eremothecium gossypii (strain ATCC 10895 / CBS 109.51 / FGSC 9923 / NRRL Y-1056) TaxID=284811 RepID=Q75AH5_EREGS|nr:ADL048Cp [Eremothecium gossypii ATCC 10895]AAS51872.1 ADL048Cp [Eremothecium gossypii ATCC 10895]AEY96170.1 FADL048Cp [Eremothecium gossypii FDAG1]